MDLVWKNDANFVVTGGTLAPSHYKHNKIPGKGIPMLKIIRSQDRLIFNMGIPAASLYWDGPLTTTPGATNDGKVGIIKTEDGHAANFLSLAAPDVVVVTTCGATIDEKVGTMKRVVMPPPLSSLGISKIVVMTTSCTTSDTRDEGVGIVKAESCHDANFVFTGGSGLEDVVTTTSVTISDDKVGVMTNPCCQCMFFLCLV